MQRYRQHLQSLGRVQAFDYEYIAEGRKVPDRQAKLIQQHQAALTGALDHAEHDGSVVLIGKSMGSRIGCHVAVMESMQHTQNKPSQFTRIRAVICLGYPLLGRSKTARMRDQVLRQLRTPTLFVQGTRDKLCPLDQLEVVRRGMRCRTALHVVQSGDHSLLGTKTHLRQHSTTQAQLESAVVDAIEAFLRNSAPPT